MERIDNNEGKSRENGGRRRTRSGGSRRPGFWWIGLVTGLLLIDLVLVGVLLFRKHGGEFHIPFTAEKQEKAETTAAETTPAETVPETTAPEVRTELMEKAKRMGMQYNYDAAIELLQKEMPEDAEAQQLITQFTSDKEALKPVNFTEITHVFFHILIVDPERALTNDYKGKDYNSTMTSIPEFKAILQQMYDRGFVLVGLHDIAEIQTGADGKEKLVKKDLRLPEGKKPFVMSEDDVCYYEYMEGTGFADKMVLDENGKLKLQYTDKDGNVDIGDYDLVPILDSFIDEHPDFSYHNSKAIIAFTGYNGILGYRTDETYDASSPNYDPKCKANPNIAEDRETVKKLTRALKEDGYEIASHSWGHINFTKRSLEDLTRDTDRWERNVEPLLPEPCEIILYPFGADIADWHGYKEDNDKFNMLYKAGFRYYCNVDSSEFWNQYGENYMRQGRRNLDGYRLYQAWSGGKNRVADLMDVQQVFDTRRPTPIDWQ